MQPAHIAYLRVTMRLIVTQSRGQPTVAAATIVNAPTSTDFTATSPGKLTSNHRILTIKDLQFRMCQR
jgi:hypothetical protein